MTLRLHLSAIFVLVLGLGLAAPVLVAAPAWSLEPVLAIEGKGWGHGVGMAQDGALAMGRAGADTPAILEQFYPATTLAASGGGIVRVAVHDSSGRVEVIGFPEGGEVRASESGPQPGGFPLAVPPGGAAEVSFDGSLYRARLLSQQVAAGDGADFELPMQLIRATATTSPPNKTRATWLSTSTTAPPPAAPPPPSPSPSPGPVSPAPPMGNLAPSGGLPPPASPAPGPILQGPPPEPLLSAPEPPPPLLPDPASVPGEVSAAGTLWAVPAPGGTTLVTARDRRYRGEVEISAVGADGHLRFVNRVDVEEYLRGMGEVRDPSWPEASLRAQAIAARTYALRAMRAGEEICDYDLCQVYIGQKVEYPEMDRAVADTRGQVLEFQGALATAVYSANAGGTTATPQEAWGGSASGAPYLRSAPYPTGDPMAWTVEVGFSDLAARFGYPGKLTGARVSNSGPSGRAVEVTLEGDAGDKTVDGLTFASRLSMKSNLFSVRTAQVEVAPPPPPDGTAFIQRLPGEFEMAAAAPPPAPRAIARVAVSLPPADRLEITGLAALGLLLVGLAARENRRTSPGAPRGRFSRRA